MPEANKEQKAVFAISHEGQSDGIPVVVIGIPGGAWDFIKNGYTNTFDLTKAGLPVKIIMYGGKDHAEVMSLMSQAISQDTEVDLGKDYSIKPK